jgi:hypothetical protein
MGLPAALDPRLAPSSLPPQTTEVIPETHYATTADSVSIAYQVTGTGPPDIVLSNASYTSNVDLQWEWPVSATLLVASPIADGC